MSAYNETIGDVDWMKWEEVKAHTKINFFLLLLQAMPTLLNWWWKSWRRELHSALVRNEDVFIKWMKLTPELLFLSFPCNTFESCYESQMNFPSSSKHIAWKLNSFKKLFFSHRAFLTSENWHILQLLNKLWEIEKR